MAAIFDIELHDVDNKINEEESDDEVIEINEVIIFYLQFKFGTLIVNKFYVLFYLFFITGRVQRRSEC